MEKNKPVATNYPIKFICSLVQQNLAPVQGGENSALKNISSRIDTHRKGARPTPARDPLTAKSNSKAKKSLFNKGSPRKVQRALRTALGRGGKDSVKLMKSAQPWVVSSAKNAETGNAQNDPAKLGKSDKMLP